LSREVHHSVLDAASATDSMHSIKTHDVGWSILKSVCMLVCPFDADVMVLSSWLLKLSQLSHSSLAALSCWLPPSFVGEVQWPMPDASLLSLVTAARCRVCFYVSSCGAFLPWTTSWPSIMQRCKVCSWVSVWQSPSTVSVWQRSPIVSVWRLKTSICSPFSLYSLGMAPLMGFFFAQWLITEVFALLSSSLRWDWIYWSCFQIVNDGFTLKQVDLCTFTYLCC
jgi:hypothetical protein